MTAGVTEEFTVGRIQTGSLVSMNHDGLDRAVVVVVVADLKKKKKRRLIFFILLILLLHILP